jgi:hypothetical protein
LAPLFEAAYINAKHFASAECQPAKLDFKKFDSLKSTGYG